MGISVNLYKKNFLIRFDKDPAIPYLSYKDYDGLNYKENHFTNSIGVRIYYFEYSYKVIKKKTVVFCPGIGPGHTAYLPEIESLCRDGYKVITLDYMGCGASDGDTLYSINEPTRDVIDLLNHLNLKEDLVLVGHSLGGYTTLNVMNLCPFIKQAVVISGFVDICSEMLTFLKIPALTYPIRDYEKEINPEFGSIDNWEYLKNTKDNILFIHSKDDPMVAFKVNTQKVIKLNNPSLEFFITDDKKHNPTYTVKAVNFMNDSINGYQKLLKQDKLKTLEERKEYFKDKPASKMTNQDLEVRNIILNYINNH